MAAIPNSRRSGGSGSHFSGLLMADPAEPARVELPPPGSDLFILRPALVLPAGVQICVDLASADADAATWWSSLAVEATYASLWHKKRNRTGPHPR
ncbi:energy transducer TonB [Candidatus Protofrankia californiensis]|uniref:energy transducer TonB n=1 Tax=Candidatus Protofrankia californiensis TaxID=1839754 RepID=UPI001041411D|nr:energy transducer TonB [Candidatus Protofrankia californiensis]